MPCSITCFSSTAYATAHTQYCQNTCSTMRGDHFSESLMDRVVPPLINILVVLVVTSPLNAPLSLRRSKTLWGFSLATTLSAAPSVPAHSTPSCRQTMSRLSASSCSCWPRALSASGQSLLPWQQPTSSQVQGHVQSFFFLIYYLTSRMICTHDDPLEINLLWR